jgi:glycosyl transferase, family 25
MNPTLNGFFINLDRSPERRAHMEAQLRRVGIDWVRRFGAIDGNTLVPPANCALSAGELACFRSHTQIIESAPPGTFTFILEDDVELSDDLPLILHPGQLEGLADYDIVLLDCQPFWATPTLLALWRSMERQLLDRADLLDPSARRRIRGVEIHDAASVYCWGLTSYLVTPRGHSKLPALLHDTLALGPPGPVDILIKHAMSDGRLKGAVLMPFLATPRLDSHARTTMQGRSQASDKLAITNAIRRMFFAGPTDGVQEYSQVFRERRPDISAPVQLLADLAAQAFAIELEQGRFEIG